MMRQKPRFKLDDFAAFERLQLLSVRDILDGNRMNPPLVQEVTKQAQRAKADNQTNLFDN